MKSIAYLTSFLTAMLLTSCDQKDDSSSGLNSTENEEFASSGQHGLDYSFYFTERSSHFFGLGDNSNRIAFVLDFSGSMDDDGKLELLQRELRKSLSQLDSQINYSVVVFASDAAFHDTNKPLPTSLGPNWHQATPQNITTSASLLLISQGNTSKKTAIHEIGKSTDWADGLNKALSLTPRPETIYFMTDGQNTEGNTNTVVRNVIDTCTTGFPATKIFAISLKDTTGETEMRAIAKGTRGQYVLIR